MRNNGLKSDEQAARRTVSLDAELDAFAQRRMKELGHTKFSHYIQELVRGDTQQLRLDGLRVSENLVLLNENEGKDLTHTGPVIITPQNQSGGGFKTRKTVKYPRGVTRKSSEADSAAKGC
jgi:hypothetical protein